MQEDVGLLKLRHHLLGVGDKIGREIAAVELHALDDVEFGFETLCLLDRDDALIADLLHRLGDHVADRLVAVRRDRADLGDLLGGGDLLRPLFDVLDDGRHRDVDSALQVHRVHPGGDELQPFPHYRGGEHGRGGRTVAGEIIGLRGHLAHHLRAHVLELVGKLDFLGDGDAVLGNARSPVGFVENDVAPLRTQRHLHRIVENIDAAQHSVAGVAGESYIFR